MMGRRRERDLVDLFDGREGYRITKGYEMMEEDDDDDGDNISKEHYPRNVLPNFPKEQSFLEE